MTARSFAARWAWLPEGLVGPVEVSFDDQGVITAVHRVARGAPGILLPGLVNAHAHLELSGLGLVPGGEGICAWAARLLASRGPDDLSAARQAARRARELGTAALIDVSNTGATAAILAGEGLRGGVQVEVLGLDPERWRGRLAHARRVQGAPGVFARPTAHAVTTCPPDLLREALAPGLVPASIHCDEDSDDALLLAHRQGPWVPLHEAIAARTGLLGWRDLLPVGDSGVDALQRLGLLGPDLALVHLCAATDLDAVARSGAAAILCPRSNLHITGRLPDAAGIVARGIPLAIGTDSLASTPDLDLLAEVAVLARALPHLPEATWLAALTTGGARLTGQDLGRIAVGTRPGLLHVDVPGDDPLRALFFGDPWPRRWVGEGGGAGVGTC